MKNFIKLFGIIALVAVIGFSFTACGDDDDGDDGKDNSKDNGKKTVKDVIGATLRLYNKPVIIGEDAEECTATNFGYYYESEGSEQPLGAAISGTPTATITSGMSKTLTISLDAPKPTALSLLTDRYSSQQYTVTPSDAKYWSVSRFWNTTEWYYLELITGGGDAELFYVDKDVTIEVGGFSPYTITLQAGWNYLLSNGPTGTRTLPNGYNWTLYAD
jgi:hypothetical protein